MNIEREETGTLTATLKVKLMPEDYNPGCGEGPEGAAQERRASRVPSWPGAHDLIKKRVGRTYW
jgi:hypothetical protein